MLKKYIWYSIVALLVVTALAVAYFHGTVPANSTEPVERTRNAENTEPKDEIVLPEKEETVKKEDFSAPSANNLTEQSETVIQNEVVPKVEEEPEELYCYLTVECGEILNNMHLLSEQKHTLVPQNGIVFPETKVLFNEGESVFHVLRREMKRAKIHLEFTMTPLFNSAYIEGINNLYEFDCGEQSGWLYSVNGEFPNYGCSGYTVKKGDKIRWIYTCSFGRDVGGYYLEGEETIENGI